MIIKTAELTGRALDYAVAFCEGWDKLTKLRETNGRLPYVFDLHHDIKTMEEVYKMLAGEPHSSELLPHELREFATDHGYLIDKPEYPRYSTEWAHGGPIIEERWISIVEQEHLQEKWGATYHVSILQEDGDGTEYTIFYSMMTGNTQLEAAMRCYVESVMGKQIEVPDEIMGVA